ncbi:hypothetical protein LTR62_000511 [Meristemomyces frigidus]|uniref:Uncharacterized protein n=1 Tax=Meristemomyces frigidus TaxID=1508187 RepID=A0AAN7YLK5_9PEZI|nr:hypothetical protein LTR62_000511 [Meristemomyces frigidus]
MFGNKNSSEGMSARPSIVSPIGGPGHSADSAYASSDPSSHRPSPDHPYIHTVPIENNGKISGVSQDRHLQLNESTGEVTDRDTGEVVTTVTTTTTTTTTTVHKGGKPGSSKETTVQVETRPSEHNDQLAEAPGDGPGSRLHPAATEPVRRTTPTPIQTQQASQYNVGDASPASPRNPNPNNAPYGEPPSPFGKHNFSYPSRADLKGAAAAGEENGYQHHEFGAQPSQPPPQSRPNIPSTIESIKAAAIGLHGVGETLRSSLNNEVDSRFPRRDQEKASAVNAKNRAEFEKGQREMARLREVNGLKATVSQQSQPIHTNTSPAGLGRGAQPVQRPADALPPPSQNADPQRNQLHAPGTWGSGRVNDIRTNTPNPNTSISPQLETQQNLHPAYRSHEGPPQLPPLQHEVSPGDRYPGMSDNARRSGERQQQQRFGTGERPPMSTNEPDRNPMQHVQAVSHVQGYSGQEQEEEERRKGGGFRKLFRRKEVGGT